MKRLLLLALLVAGAAHAQAPPAYKVYSCANLNAAGTNAKTFSSCGSTQWSWQNPPRRDADTPLVAACTNCGWNAPHVVTWKRPRDVAANDFVSTCTSNVAVGSRSNCASEPFVLRDAVLLAPPPTDPPPPPDPTMEYFRISATNAQIWTYESVTVEWSALNATSCSANWGGAIGTRGTATSGPYTFPIADVELAVVCTNAAGRGTQGSAHFEVKSKVPPCKPGLTHVLLMLQGAVPPGLAAARLQSADANYTLKVVYFCRMPSGPPKKFAYATSWSKLFDEGMKQRDGTYNDAAVNEECERSCQVTLPPAQQTEVDTWSAPFTVEQLGVIE
jgi:hypothetical protein